MVSLEKKRRKKLTLGQWRGGRAVGVCFEGNASERKLKTPSVSLLFALNCRAAQLLLSVVPLFQ